MEEEKKKLERSRTDKVLAGVAGGLAEYFEVDPTVMRLIFIVLTLISGSGIILYIILAILMPENKNQAKVMEKNEGLEKIRNQTQELANDIRSRASASRQILGFIILLVGLLFLAREFFPGLWQVEVFWPAVLVLLGLYFIFKAGGK